MIHPIAIPYKVIQCNMLQCKEYDAMLFNMVALPPPCDLWGTFILKSHWHYGQSHGDFYCEILLQANWQNWPRQQWTSCMRNS